MRFLKDTFQVDSAAWRNLVKMLFKVVISADVEDGGFNVSCPAIPGCHSQGETREEAVANIREAIIGCLDVLNDRAQKRSGDDIIAEVAV